MNNAQFATQLDELAAAILLVMAKLEALQPYSPEAHLVTRLLEIHDELAVAKREVDTLANLVADK